MKTCQRLNSGFTLTEAVVSIAILVLVWIATVDMILISKTSESLAKHKMQAAYVIQTALEDLQKKPFTAIANSTATVSIDTRGTPDIVADDFTGTRVITVTSYSYYKKVVVALTWREIFPGAAKNVTEYGGTYIANDTQAN